MKRKIAIITLALTLTLSGCGVQPVESPGVLQGESIQDTNSQESETQTDDLMGSSEQESSEESKSGKDNKELPTGGEKNPITEREVKDGKMQSYLTGEWKDEEVVKRRNMAVMIPNNERAGYNSSSPKLHQYGISQASIIYEAPVEGRITRLMCIFEDYDDLGKIGPIRSSRDYYIYEAMAFDSIYVNWGLARPWVEELINSDRVDNISAAVAGIYNGYDAAFFRDTSLLPGAASEFTGYLNVDKYTSGVEARGYKKNYRSTFEQAFSFANDRLATYDDYPDATMVWPGGTEQNSGGYGNYGKDNVHFEYNEEDHLYYRYQYGEPMVDNMNDEQIAVTNVVFKVCHGEERLPDNPEYDYLAFGIHGSGDCYIFTNGKVIKGTWKREGDNGANYYYDRDGKEIVLNQGKTWMCCIWKEFSQNISYE